MTVFDTSYSSLEYQPVGPLARLWPIIKMEFLQIFRQRKGLLIFIGCVAFVVVKALLLWATLSPDSEAMAEGIKMLERMSPSLSPLRPEFYINHATDWGWLPFLFLTSLVSVRSISGDRAVNALEIYWTRGISPWGYFVGKWMGSFLLLAAAFLAGPVVLWLYGVIAAADGAFWDRTVEFMPSVLAALTLHCLVMSFLAVGFSSMSSSPNIAMFLWLLMIGGSKTLGTILTTISAYQLRRTEVVFEPPWYKAICPYEGMIRIQEDMAGIVPGPSDFEQIWIAWAILGVYALVILWNLRRLLRNTEAVA
jgi:ABC-type transport system involved in multi-copper enzyme maturation permease subunit